MRASGRAHERTFIPRGRRKVKKLKGRLRVFALRQFRTMLLRILYTLVTPTTALRYRLQALPLSALQRSPLQVVCLLIRIFVPPLSLPTAHFQGKGLPKTHHYFPPMKEHKGKEAFFHVTHPCEPTAV